MQLNVTDTCLSPLSLFESASVFYRDTVETLSLWSYSSHLSQKYRITNRTVQREISAPNKGETCKHTGCKETLQHSHSVDDFPMKYKHIPSSGRQMAGIRERESEREREKGREVNRLDVCVMVQYCCSAESAGGGTCVSTCTSVNDKSPPHSTGLISLYRPV